MKKILSKINDIEVRKNLFMIFVALILILSGIYLYNLKTMVFAVAERQNNEKLISSVNEKVAELQSAYISQTNKINLNVAYAYGFKDAPDAKFVTRKAIGSAVALNNEI